MPRGLAAIQQVAKENAAKRAAYDESGPGIRHFRINDGEMARVRFLEQGDEVEAPWCHQLPKLPGRFPDWALCLDQNGEGNGCPGCEMQKTRSARLVVNLIWFDAPKFVRDSEKKIVKDPVTGKPKLDGTENVVAVWHRSVAITGRLGMLDDEHGGLTLGICKIRRTGSTKDDTEYHIDWEKKVQPTEEEVKLFQSKGDPKKVFKSLNYGDMKRAYTGGGTASSSSEGTAQEAGAGNAFAAAQQGAINRGAFS